MLCWQVGWTGLILAAQSGHEAVVRLLIEHKAEVNAAKQVLRACTFKFTSIICDKWSYG
jgi:hypothetical protein